TKHLHDFAARAAGFDNKAGGEADAAHRIGERAAFHFDALHHAAPLDALDDAGLGRDRAEPLAETRRLARRFGLELSVLPVEFERACRGDEGVVVAAEGAVVLARLPTIVVRLDERQGERKPKARKRLGHGDDVGLEARPLETEEPARAADAGLDVVDDEERARALGEAGDAPQPVIARGVEPALAL